MQDYGYIKKNFDALRSEIKEISDKLGRPEPTLVCVTKSGSDEELIALVRAGAADLGENRPGEVKRRYELLCDLGLSVNMHEIGTLQRNKVKLVAPCTSMIHSIDSYKLAADVSRHAVGLGRVIPVLIEINSAREENKSGVMPEYAEDLLKEIIGLPGISVVGLMTMGPVSESSEDLRPYFRLTKELFDSLSEKYGFGDSPILSMGMSDSYKVAIEEGSTLVRVGRKLFIK
ncbi:MAG: YggS family pyridoxal phosphate-dependent enzyme [Clostridia bacterium]|nr:YggS family pyridoxal phosphate-dependent enzyme [Clostridia bacterium]